MFLLDHPYVSDFLRDTARSSGAPVLDTEMARRLFGGERSLLLDSAAFAEQARRPGARLYSNSENALDWVLSQLADTDLPRRIRLFKDKVQFRRLTEPLFPDYVYREVQLDALDAIDPRELPKPFVIKPAVGFFSLGVHVVESDAAWPAVKDKLRRQVERSRDIYPGQVLGLERFVIEQGIDGEEYAVDAYFDADGEPVIVGALAHMFADAHDVSDRVYTSSPALVDRLHAPVTEFLRQVGELADLKDFPVHVEVRIDDAGKLLPIEINALRFGGWCATDMAWHAFGVNPYLAYLRDERPDWGRIGEERAGREFALVVADLSVDVDRERIASVDYDAFVARFKKPLELRRVDYRKYPVFAFLFVEVVDGDFSELRAVLGEDLSGYLRMET